ncbi:MAG: hypothetical protein JWL90_3172 [Chthoniobacteraceae bacterium]|nr:hypothetical protein [Chthoniobacteraceae bacterium]
MFAIVLSFASFVGSIVVLDIAFTSAVSCHAYARGIAEPNLYAERFEFVAYAILGVTALGIAAFAFVAARRHIHPTTVFHARFFTGVSLLGYSLWLAWARLPIARGHLLFDWSTKVLYPAFLAPLTCLLLVPIGLLLICFAILHDPLNVAQSSNRKAAGAQ